MVWTIVVLVYMVNLLSAFIIALRDARRPLRALIWVLICAALPGLGILIYGLLSRPLVQRSSPQQFAPHHALSWTTTSPKPEAVNRPQTTPDNGDVPTQLLPARFRPSAVQIATWVTNVLAVQPVLTRVNVLTNGVAKYRALLDALYRAEHQIDVEYYIYRDDEIGRAVTQALLHKASSGVKIRFLRDGFGSRKLSRATLRALQSAGVEVRTMHPIRFPWLSPAINHRDHCKIVLIDGHVTFTGGLNIGDEYTGRSPKTGPWRDTHLELHGVACAGQLQAVFNRNWELGKPLSGSAAATPEKQGSRREQSEEFSFGLRGKGLTAVEAATELAVFPQAPGTPQSVYLQTVDSGPQKQMQSIRDLFFLCATEARQTLDITTPYFAPDTDILTALKTASERGVSVRLLVPAKPDHTLIGWASTTYYGDLIEAGVQIFLHEQGVLHAKVVIMDGDTSVVGAANYDLRSFRENYEVCEVLYGREISARLTQDFEEDLTSARPLELSELNALPKWKKIRNSGARLLAPLL